MTSSSPMLTAPRATTTTTQVTAGGYSERSPGGQQSERGSSVFVQGAVNSPGSFVIRRGATVQQVINMAGGISVKGRNTGIKIQRPYADPKKKPLEIQVKDYKTELVKAGDTIIVPNRRM